MLKQTHSREDRDHRENDKTKPNSSMNTRDFHFGFDEMNLIAEQKPVRGAGLIKTICIFHLT
jgi:hypothetical protein